VMGRLAAGDEPHLVEEIFAEGGVAGSEAGACGGPGGTTRSSLAFEGAWPPRRRGPALRPRKNARPRAGERFSGVAGRAGIEVAPGRRLDAVISARGTLRSYATRAPTRRAYAGVGISALGTDTTPDGEKPRRTDELDHAALGPIITTRFPPWRIRKLSGGDQLDARGLARRERSGGVRRRPR